MRYKVMCSAALKIGVGVLLLVAMGRHPYSFYTLLRWVVCGVSAYCALEAAPTKKQEGAIAFGVMALMFNPFVPARFDRATWRLIDCAAAAVLVGSLFIRAKESTKERSRNTGPD